MTHTHIRTDVLASQPEHSITRRDRHQARTPGWWCQQRGYGWIDGSPTACPGEKVTVVCAVCGTTLHGEIHNVVNGEFRCEECSDA